MEEIETVREINSTLLYDKFQPLGIYIIKLPEKEFKPSGNRIKISGETRFKHMEIQ